MELCAAMDSDKGIAMEALVGLAGFEAGRIKQYLAGSQLGIQLHSHFSNSFLHWLSLCRRLAWIMGLQHFHFCNFH